MSQNPRALKIVAEDSGHSGLVLRPLSAKIMAVTEAEKNGWVDRDRLLGLSGRGRRPQMDLANHYGLHIPPPAGGCLLTDQNYSRRLKWLLESPHNHENWPPARLANLIKLGRLFASAAGQPLLVGRNQAGNQALNALAQPQDLLFHLEGAPGPTVLLALAETGQAPDPSSLALGAHLAAAYGDHGPRTEVTIRIDRPGQAPEFGQTPVTKPEQWLPQLV